jgi:hypothetical protein
MATRRKPTKERRPEMKPEIWAWLCDENEAERDAQGTFSLEIFLLDGQWVHHHGDESDELLKLWREVEPDVLDYFIANHPGQRPRLWWRYSAPRIPVGIWDVVADSYLDGKLPEPRLQVSGAGGAPWDMGFAHAPWFECGLPQLWEDFDPKDAPRFESQANYLRRHGLLMPGEEKSLKPEDFEPESYQLNVQYRKEQHEIVQQGRD